MCISKHAEPISPAINTIITVPTGWPAHLCTTCPNWGMKDRDECAVFVSKDRTTGECRSPIPGVDQEGKPIACRAYCWVTQDEKTAWKETHGKRPINGRLVRFLREAKNLTPHALCELANIHGDSLRRIEEADGLTICLPKVLEPLAAALGVSVEQLGREEQESAL